MKAKIGEDLGTYASFEGHGAPCPQSVTGGKGTEHRALRWD